MMATNQRDQMIQEEITDLTTTATNNDSEAEIFDRIASKLLRSGLHLTALELHAELIERGKECARLRDYFENPHNFEKHFDMSHKSKNHPSTTITSNTNDEIMTTIFPRNTFVERRSPSENTVDSLDFAQYSDDDDNNNIERHIGDERIAVLEFELRKARQTIDSLRASLTMTTTGQYENDDDDKLLANESQQQQSTTTATMNDMIDSTIKNNDNDFIDEFNHDFYYRGSADGDSCPGDDDKISKRSTTTNQSNTNETSSSTPIKPHEKRALNYLINEYLMANNYKLTSITFCDENTEQDFDNWNEVGLNITKPPDLLRIYRQFWNISISSSSSLLLSSTNHQQNKQNSNYLIRSNSNATTVVSNNNNND